MDNYNYFKNEIKKRLTDYPWKVIDGEIVACRHIIAACKRYDEFLKRDDMYFDCENVERVVRFIGKLKHFTGEYNNLHFELQPWQIWCLSAVYGFKWKSNGLRVTRTFLLSVGRKAGKSSLLSAMALWALLEEPGAQCICAANSAAQATILFKMASNYLKSLGKGVDKMFRRYRDRIILDKTNSEIRVVSADASRLDGLNCSFYVEDETAAAPSSEVWDILEQSAGSRSQPLACSVTTRGFQLSGFYKELEDSAIEVINGVKNDDSIFAAIYCLDDEDDYTDQKNWIKCQPNLGVSVHEDFIKQQIVKAGNNPTQLYSIATKIFNRWQSSSDSWIPINHIWDSMKEVNVDDFKEEYCYISFDLASVCDLTCLGFMCEKDGRYYIKLWYYLPHDSIDGNENSEKYKRWAKQGWLTVTDGNVTDYDYVINDIKKIQDKTIIQKCPHDQWNATDMSIRLTELGIPLEPYSQSLQSMNLATKTFERLMLSGKIVLDKNPITAWCFENAKTKFDYLDNVRIIKNTNMQKIDGAIVAIMLIGGYLSDDHYNNDFEGMSF